RTRQDADRDVQRARQEEMVAGRPDHICHRRAGEGAERQGGMILRTLAALAGLGVVAAATHANIMHAGGYGSTEAYLIITVAAFLAVGVWGTPRSYGATTPSSARRRWCCAC